MNWIDIVIIAVVLWFTLTAFHAGFIRETMTMIAAVLGVVVAGLFYKDIASAVFVFPDNETVANIVAFGTIFGAVVLAGQLMAMLLKPAVHAFQLGVFDQLAGAGFGFLKAMVFVEVFLIVCITFPRGGVPQDIHNSMFGGLIVDRTASVVVKILPSEFKTAVDEFNGTL